MIDRKNGGWINHLGTKITEFCCFAKAQSFNSICVADDFWIGSHKSVHIRPDFEFCGIKCRCKDGCSIVGTTTPQIGDIAGFGIGGNKSAAYTNPGGIGKRFQYKFIGSGKIDDVFVELIVCFDKITGIKVHCILYQMAHNNG